MKQSVFKSIVGLLSLIFITNGLRAQQLTPLQDLVSQASSLTKSAKTVEDCTKLLKICQQSKNVSLTAHYQKYFRELSAWTYNKRGELQSKKAAEFEAEAEQLALEKKALLDFENAVRLNPKLWIAYYNRGLSHALIGDVEKAIEDFGKTIEANPNYANAWFNRAELRYQLGNPQSASADYTQAIKLNPQDAAAYNGRGHCLYLREKYREALADYSQAIRIAPKNPRGYANRADALSDLGYWETAIKDYHQAITLDPKFVRAKQGQAWIYATCPQTEFYQPQKALQLIHEALAEQQGVDYRYFDTLAAAQAALGKFEEAQSNIEKAVKIAPDSERPLLKDRQVLYQASRHYREPKR